MKSPNRLFDLQTHSGQPLLLGDVTITPQSQALTLRWPYGGLVWNRPVAVVVEQDGDQHRLPIVDLTLIVRLLQIALGLAAGMSLLILAVRKRRVQDD